MQLVRVTVFSTLVNTLPSNQRQHTKSHLNVQVHVLSNPTHAYFQHTLRTENARQEHCKTSTSLSSLT